MRIPSSTYFDALNSNRRLEMVRQTEGNLADLAVAQLRRTGDRLAEIDELAHGAAGTAAAEHHPARKSSQAYLDTILRTGSKIVISEEGIAAWGWDIWAAASTCI